MAGWSVSRGLRAAVATVVALVTVVGTSVAAEWGRFLPEDCDVAIVVKGTEPVLRAVEAYGDQILAGLGLQIRSSLELALATALGTSQWDGLAENGVVLFAYDDARQLTSARASWIAAQVANYELFIRSLFPIGDDAAGETEQLDGPITRITYAGKAYFVAKVDDFAVIARNEATLRSLLAGKLKRPVLAPAAADVLQQHVFGVYANVRRLLKRFEGELEMVKAQLQLMAQLAAQQQQQQVDGQPQLGQAQELAGTFGDFIARLGEVSYVTFGASAAGGLLTADIAVQPVADSKLAEFIGSVGKQVDTSELEQLPAGAHAYYAFPLTDSAAATWASWLIPYDAQHLQRRLWQEHLEELARAGLRSVLEAIWLDPEEGIRSLVVVRTEDARAGAEAMTRWYEDLAKDAGKGKGPYKSVVVRRGAVLVGDATLDEIKATLSDQLLETLRQIEQATGGGGVRLVRAEQVVLVGAVAGHVVLVTASSRDAAVSTIEQFMADTQRLSRDPAAANVLKALGGKSAGALLMDVGRLAGAYMAQAPIVQPAYLGLSGRMVDATATVRLVLPAASITQVLQIGAAALGGQAPLVD